eukprot:jgi/Botrbrau1/12494/Bobra.0169s0041.1
MSACVREFFARMEGMDPTLRDRLADWLAYHLSNYEFMWPWQKWAHVLDAPACDAPAEVCGGHAVQADEAVLLEASGGGAAGQLPRAVASRGTSAAAAQPPAWAGGQTGSEGPPADEKDPEGWFAARILQLIRGKMTSEDLLQMVREAELRTKGWGLWETLRQSPSADSGRAQVPHPHEHCSGELITLF